MACSHLFKAFCIFIFSIISQRSIAINSSGRMTVTDPTPLNLTVLPKLSGRNKTHLLDNFSNIHNLSDVDKKKLRKFTTRSFFQENIMPSHVTTNVSFSDTSPVEYRQLLPMSSTWSPPTKHENENVTTSIINYDAKTLTTNVIGYTPKKTTNVDQLSTLENIYRITAITTNTKNDNYNINYTTNNIISNIFTNFKHHQNANVLSKNNLELKSNCIGNHIENSTSHDDCFMIDRHNQMTQKSVLPINTQLNKVNIHKKNNVSNKSMSPTELLIDKTRLATNEIISTNKSILGKYSQIKKNTGKHNSKSRSTYTAQKTMMHNFPTANISTIKNRTISTLNVAIISNEHSIAKSEVEMFANAIVHSNTSDIARGLTRNEKLLENGSVIPLNLIEIPTLINNHEDSSTASYEFTTPMIFFKKTNKNISNVNIREKPTSVINQESSTATSVKTMLELCDVKTAEQLQDDVMGHLRHLVVMFSMFHADISLMVKFKCKRWPDLRNKFTRSLYYCDVRYRLKYDMLVEIVDFACFRHNGSTAINASLPCYTDSRTFNGVGFCKLGARWLTSYRGECRGLLRFVQCLRRVYSKLCGPEASVALQQIIIHATNPLRQQYRCTGHVDNAYPTPKLPTGTATSLPHISRYLASTPSLSVNKGPYSHLRLKCYECVSGGPHRPRYDKMCSDGDMEKMHLSLGERCRGLCYAKTNIIPSGSVTRGCTEKVLHQFPSSVPPKSRGCQLIGRETWCFCSRHQCNNQDMEQYITSELP